jgi:hypothetical protein
MLLVAALLVALPGAAALTRDSGPDRVSDLSAPTVGPPAQPSGESSAQEHSKITAAKKRKPRRTPTPTPTRTTPSVTKPAPTPVASPTSVTGLNPGTRVSSARSGLKWASGVYIPGSSPASAEAFGKWRGRKVDVVVDWPARQTWNDLVDPGWLYDAWKGTPYTKVFGLPPFPEGGNNSLTACAAGAYNSKWVQFGRNIAAQGLAGQTIIRLGWEFNGTWYQWQATNPAAFTGCWKQVYESAESTAPALRWDWSVNRGPSQALPDATKAYPGDAYVDIVGVDSYDQYPGATGAAGWNQQYAGAYGLKFWADFAAAHHKRISIPEWGLYPSRGRNGGGDDAYYVAKMEAFFASLGDRLAYESYFDESAGYYGGSIFGPNENPVAAAKYRSLLTR